MRVGIQLEMDKDWHIYWMNPGDSGEPPQVYWRLPAGVTMGALEWPAPMRLKTGAGTDYVYEGNAVLLSILKTPLAAQPGTNLTIAADLRWLVCSDTCIPQRAELQASVRMASADGKSGDAAAMDSRTRELLTAAAERIPKPLPARLHLTASGSRDKLRLDITNIVTNNVTNTVTYNATHGVTDGVTHDRATDKVLPTTIASASFFPAEPEQIDNAAPQEFSNAGNMVSLGLKKSDHLLRDPKHLRGLLLLNEQDSYEVDVPIRELAARHSATHATTHGERK